MGQALFGKQGWDWGRGGTGRAGPRLPLPFSNDSWAVMLEGASGIDHLLQQAHFTSAISETGSGQSQSSVEGRGPITHAHSRGHVCPSRAPRVPAFIKTLMLGKIEGKRRREWQRMRWLDSITCSVDMNLGNSRRQWGTEAPGVLPFTGSQSRTQLSDWTTSAHIYMAGMGWEWSSVLDMLNLRCQWPVFLKQNVVYQTSLVVQWLRICLPMQETWVQSLGQEDPLEERMATRSSVLAWKSPWTEDPGRSTVHGVSESRTRLSNLTTTTRFCILRIQGNRSCYFQ